MPESVDILIVIPAYNAAATLPELVHRCQKAAPDLPLVVVNDDSTDDTSAVLAELEIIVLTHEHNRGKGEALKTGFSYAAEHGFAAVLHLDADLQHAPESIPHFIDLYRSAQFDIIIGARTIELSVMPFARWATNRLTSWIISKMAGQQITDSQSGYRLITVACWEAIPLATTGYDLESEILIKAGKMGFTIGEVPIETIYTGGKSYINPLADSWRFIRLVWRNRGKQRHGGAESRILPLL